jgi:hypothetical protein
MKESTLHLVLRLRGGGYTKEFADVSNPILAKDLQFSESAPIWREVCNGLNFEGMCKNKGCKAYNR